VFFAVEHQLAVHDDEFDSLRVLKGLGISGLVDDGFRIEDRDVGEQSVLY
jgi:hypothetical protein